MKVILFGVALTIAASLGPSQKTDHAASIEINGVSLRLGMTKSEVEQKFQGSQIVKSSQDGWLIGNPGSLLHFTVGRLTFAERNWPNQSNDIGEQLFGAVNSINSEGFYNCRVYTDVKTDPAATLHRVWIDCGDKSVLVARYVGASGKVYNTVDEHLGHLRNTDN